MIEGQIRFSRFGYAMANLGDINGDGWDGMTTLSINGRDNNSYFENHNNIVYVTRKAVRAVATSS